MSNDLTPAEVRERLAGNNLKLFDALHGNGDVPIDDLFTVLVGLEDWNDSPRYRQQLVGSRLAYMNKKLVEWGLIAKPGRVKRTYCLYRA